MHFTRPRRLLALSLSPLASLPALAADEPHYNQISLRAEASQEVARDLMIVTLYTEAQNSDPAKLAADVTTTLNKALGQAKAVKEITLSQAAATATRSTTTRPRRSRLARTRRAAPGKRRLCRVVQADRRTDAGPENGKHELRHFHQHSQGQRGCPVQGSHRRVQARAQLATEALGGKGYKIVNLNLNSNGYPQPYARGAMMMKAAAMDAAPTPDVEAGKAQVNMNADGVIEVQQ